MLYMCTYTCGIWDVITWIREQQGWCKTGNHFQLQVGWEALLKVQLCCSVAVKKGIYWVSVTFQNFVPLFLHSLLLTAILLSFFVFLCQLWRASYLLILAWETSILGSQTPCNNIFWTQSPSPVSSIRHTCNLYFPAVLLSTLHHLPAPPPSLRTCFLLSLLNASPWEMDGGESILLRWKFLRSYGYDLVGRSGSIFAGRLMVGSVLAVLSSKHFKEGQCTESRWFSPPLRTHTHIHLSCSVLSGMSSPFLYAITHFQVSSR